MKKISNKLKTRKNKTNRKLSKKLRTKKTTSKVMRGGLIPSGSVARTSVASPGSPVLPPPPVNNANNNGTNSALRSIASLPPPPPVGLFSPGKFNGNNNGTSLPKLKKLSKQEIYDEILNLYTNYKTTKEKGFLDMIDEYINMLKGETFKQNNTNNKSFVNSIQDILADRLIYKLTNQNYYDELIEKLPGELKSVYSSIINQHPRSAKSYATYHKQLSLTGPPTSPTQSSPGRRPAFTPNTVPTTTVQPNRLPLICPESIRNNHIACGKWKLDQTRAMQALKPSVLPKTTVENNGGNNNNNNDDNN
jgi:hypothetical protein